MELDKVREAQHTSNVTLAWLMILTVLNSILTIALLVRVNSVIEFFEELGRVF